jgi:predicted alpha/beta superfamily hydrolase
MKNPFALKIGLLFCLLSFIIQSKSSAQENKMNTSVPPPVSIPGTQQLQLTSSIVARQEYILHVHLPRHYNDTTKRFPVVYLLDSQWDFPLLSAIYGGQYYDGFMPEVIVVGITWGGENPNHEQLRARDFTPTSPDKSPQYGNAANFLSFIKKELTPFIESKYRVKKNDRTLIGSSLGGLFTLYALFNETNFFQRYVLTSPATHWDNKVIYKIEKEYSNQKTGLPARVYMATGALEDVTEFNKWISTLKSRNYKGLQLQTKVLANIGHAGTKPEGYTRGFQWVFKRPSVSLSPSQLQPYVGTYTLGNETIRMIIENNSLVGLAGTNKIKLVAETERDFYLPGSFMFLHFKKDKESKVSGFQFENFSGEVFVKKTD